MNRKIFTVVLFLFAGFAANAQNLSSEDQRIVEDAQRAKADFIAEGNDMQQMFDNSYAYVIFPNVGKGAYIVGGAAGNGAVYENGNLIGMAKLRQLDVGLQLGGKAFSEVIFFEDKQALEEFKQEELQLSGNASAVVIEEGKSGAIAFKDGIAIATMPKAGAMVSVSVGGQKFSFEPLN